MRPCPKIVYPSPRAAALALRCITRRQRSRGLTAPVAVHWCRTCRAWHLTSQKASGRLARQLQVAAGLTA